jgi:hypothetical protein
LLLALPEGEEALVISGGDAAPEGSWEYTTAKGESAARRFVLIKPSVIGSSAGLHIISNHTIPYNFTVHEVSNDPGQPADVSVFLIATGDLASKVSATPTLVTADVANNYKQAALSAEAKLDEARTAAEANIQVQVNRYRTQYSKQLDHNYSFDRLKEPFNVTDVATDGTLTLVYVDPKRTKAGAIYVEEGKKKKPSIPNYDYDAEHGIYTIQGRIDRGYLEFKDSRVEFARLKDK